MQDRIKWIDWAKVIGMFLVVLGHIQSNTQVLTNFIYSFHMPLFFFISGFLTKPKSLSETLKINLNRVLIPYILYYLLTWIWWYFISYLRHPELFDHSAHLKEAFIKPIVGLILGVGYDTEYSRSTNGPLWFLIGIFVTNILFFIIYNANKKILIIKSLFLAFLSYLLLSYYDLDLLFSIDSALMTMPFFILGYCMANMNLAINIIEYIKKPFFKLFINLIFIIFLFFMVFFVMQKNGRVDVNGYNFGNNPIFFYIGAFLGLILVLTLSKLFSNIIYNNSIITISNGTMLIMAIHGIITGCIFFVIKSKLSFLLLNPLINIYVSILVLIVCLPLIKLVQKKFPILLGNRKTI